MSRPSLPRVTAVLALVATQSACDGTTTTAPTPVVARLAQPRVLVVTYAAEFRHSSIESAERAFDELSRSSGIFAVEHARTADDVRRLLAADSLAAVHAVAFINTTGNIGVPDVQALVDWVGAGHAFIGAHSASDTYHTSPAYLAMLGNEFLEHGDQATVEAVVEAPQHEAVAHLGPRYRVFDEIYRFVRNNRDVVTPLLTLDRHPLDGLTGAGQPGDLPLAWVRQHGQGRVFYTALGPS